MASSQEAQFHKRQSSINIYQPYRQVHVQHSVSSTRLIQHIPNPAEYEVTVNTVPR